MVRIVTKLSLLAAVLSLIINAYACEKLHDTEAHEIAAKIGDFSTCQSDKDCMTVNADCCGCTKGGKQRSVNTTSAKAMLGSMKQACAQTMCMQMISNDESCKKSATCVDGECLLR